MLTQKQEKDLAIIRTFYPNFSEKDLVQYNISLCFGTSKEMIDQAIDNGIYDKHRKDYLIRYDISSGKVGRCIETGQEKWRRVDGRPIGLSDLTAIRNLNYGQGMYFEGKEGDHFIKVDWVCDASD